MRGENLGAFVRPAPVVIFSIKLILKAFLTAFLTLTHPRRRLQAATMSAMVDWMDDLTVSIGMCSTWGLERRELAGLARGEAFGGGP